MRINWKQKLSSRKFWIAVIGFVSAAGFAFNVDPGSAERLTGMIMSGASLIAYILSEGFIDGRSAAGKTTADQIMTDKVIFDKVMADKVMADKVMADKKTDAKTIMTANNGDAP